MKEKIKVKDRVLKAATDLFYHRGFNQTGINQIIAEADIAIGSLYNHFSSKNDLLLAYLKRQETEWFEGIEFFSKGINNPKERILKLIDYRIELQIKSNFSGCPFIKIIAELGSTDLKALQFVKELKEKQQAQLYELLIPIPYKASLDKKSLAETLFLMIEGATVNATIYRNVIALRNVKEFFQKID